MAEPQRKSGLRYEFAKDRKSVKITFPPIPAQEQGRRVAVTFDLTTKQIDALIESLGRLREDLLDQHPPRLDHTRKVVRATINPAWEVGDDKLRDAIALHLRHVGFGWLHFVLPKPEAARLGKGLFERGQALDAAASGLRN